MPTFVVPHKSGAHRVAAIALYRALLTQCRKTNLSAANGDGTQELYNVIRHRFRGFRHCGSHKQLKVVFEAGYEAVDYLDAAVEGDEKAKEYLEGLVMRAPRRVKEDQGLLRRVFRESELDTEAVGDGDVVEPGMAETLDSKPRIRTYVSETPLVKRRVVQNEEMAEHGPGKDHKMHDEGRSILDRPIPKAELGGTGMRHVPVLFNANHIPVLRFKKPQPPALSGYINHRIEVRQKRHDRKARYEADILLARQEDRWDSIVNQHHGIDSRHTTTEDGGVILEPLWKQVPADDLQEVNALLRKEKDSARVMGKKMFDIVQREKNLALLESEDDQKAGESEEELQLSSLVDDIVEADGKKAAMTTHGEYQPLG